MENLAPTSLDDLLQAVCRSVAGLLADAPAPERISVRAGDITVELEWPAAPAGHASVAPPAGGLAAAAALPVAEQAAGQAPAEVEDGQFCIRAAAVGTFFRAPEPGAAPYVSEGEVVRPGQQVAVLEAMKVMLPVEATASGRVVEFLVENGSPVEFDTPLIKLAPAAA